MSVWFYWNHLSKVGILVWQLHWMLGDSNFQLLCLDQFQGISLCGFEWSCHWEVTLYLGRHGSPVHGLVSLNVYPGRLCVPRIFGVRIGVGRYHSWRFSSVMVMAFPSPRSCYFHKISRKHFRRPTLGFGAITPCSGTAASLSLLHSFP